MKKFLSIILAAALVISLVPSVFASDAKNVMDFDFSGSEVGLNKATGAGNVTDFSMVDYEYKVYSDYNNVHYLANGIIARPKKGSADTAVSGSPFALFKIKINKAGIYTPEFVYASNEYGATARLYLLSPTEIETLGFKAADKSDAQQTFKKIVAGTSGTNIGQIDTSAPVNESDDYKLSGAAWSAFTFASTATATLDPITLVQGEYYLFVSAVSAPKFYTQSDKVMANLAWKNLKFTEVIPASVKISADKTVLEVNETAQVTSVVTGDNGKEMTVAVTYESSAPSIASVDADGVVTANAAGMATITAKTANGKTDSLNITVEESIKYEFILPSMKADFTSETTFSMAKDGSSDGSNYEWIADGKGQWDNLNTYGSHSFTMYHGNTGFRLQRGASVSANINGTMYRINVPKAGKYKLTYNYFDSPVGLKTGIWFADEKMLAEKNITLVGDKSNTGCRLVMANFEPDIEIDTYNKDEETDVTNLPVSRVVSVIGEKEYNLAAGEYYVVIGATGISWDNSPAGEAAAGNADGAFSYMLYRGIDLVKVGDYVAPEAPKSPELTELFVYDPTSDGAVTSDEIPIGSKLDVPVGITITLKAKESSEDGSFVGWKNGAGVLLSTNPEETFDIITKTVIMAVYDKENASPKVEFWNANGSHIKTVEVEAGTKFADVAKPSASLNGYGAASGWSISDDAEINGIVRAVATYDYEDTGVAVDNVRINGEAVEDAAYNQKLTLSEKGATYWTRNAKTVAFGESFVHYVFNSANGSALVAHKGAVTVRPIVTLDTNKSGYSMIEYDAAGMKIVEAGIIYGPNKNISLNAYVTKASVKNLKSHGQFIAAPNADSSLDQSVARGYIVYINDENEYKVAYSD